MQALLVTRGVNSIVAPVMEIQPEPLPQIIPEGVDALLLSSRHAAHMLSMLPEAMRQLPVFCVGEATAEAARASSATQVQAGDEDMLALLPRLVAAMGGSGHLYYLAGNEVRVPVAELLPAQGIRVSQHVAYRAEAASQLTPELVEALQTKRVTGVSFFSPRSATIARALLAQHGLPELSGTIDAYCLSLAVAEAAGMDWRRIKSCARPRREDMIDLIVSESV